jgi:hypothetical protein
LKSIHRLLAFAVLATAGYAGVTVTSPVNGSVANSPLHVVASASPNSSAPVTAMQIYVDGVLKYQVNATHIDTYLTVAYGAHQISVKAWDSSGANFMTATHVTASGSGVSLSSPADRAVVNGSVHVVGTASSPYGIVATQIYDNGNLVAKLGDGNLDKWLTLTPGSHYIMVQAWDATGTIFFHPVTVNSSGAVAQSQPASTNTQANIPSNASVKRDIDQMAGWQSCDACAGAGGAGPVDPYSMTQNIHSPSVDGSAATFWLGGTTPWGNALWWKQLGAVDSAKHFVYDVQFFINNPVISQALEFDVNQSVSGLKYIFGTECAVRTNAGWKVWDTANARWIVTGASCSVKAGAWNHLTWELERVGGQTHFIAVTLNGYRQVVNRYYNARSSGVRELNIAFQMDGDEHQDDYQVWLDKATLYYW